MSDDVSCGAPVNGEQRTEGPRDFDGGSRAIVGCLPVPRLASFEAEQLEGESASGAYDLSGLYAMWLTCHPPRLRNAPRGGGSGAHVRPVRVDLVAPAVVEGD